MRLTPELRKTLGSAKPSGNGANIRHGKYALMIDKWFFKKGHKGISEIRELVVLEAEKVVVMEGEKERADTPNAVGSSCSIVSAYHGDGADMGPINTMRFLYGLFNLSEGDITAEEQETTIAECTNTESEDGAVNPMRGMVIGLETFPVLTSKNKKWITGTKWICIDKPGEGVNTVEEAAARWATHEAQLRGKDRAPKA